MACLSSDQVLRLRPGCRVGVLGGSFDPPHAGHLHLSREAMKRFGLDEIMWLVSPGNPLKARAPAPLASRIAAARALVDHPHIFVSDLEARLGTRFTSETLGVLTARWPAVRFVWLMGADNLAQLHHWENWRSIMSCVPVGVLARPGLGVAARTSPAARIFRTARLTSSGSHLLGQARAPAWCFVNMPMRRISSTQLRQQGQWGRSSGIERAPAKT